MAKILVVDDEVIIRDLFKKVLSREGHEVLTAATGEECLKTIEKEGADNIHMVFLDLKMPGIGGEKTLEELRRLYKELPVVIITGYGTLQELMILLKKDIAGYIDKPFDSEYVKLLVRKIVE